MKRTVAVLLSFVSLAAAAQTIDASKVPAAVKATFAKNFPTIKDAKWEKEKGDYEANFKDGSNKMSALFTPAGAWTETEKSMAVAGLPAKAKEYLNAHYKGAKIKEAAELKLPDGRTNYEAGVKGTDIIFDGNGNFLKTQKG